MAAVPAVPAAPLPGIVNPVVGAVDRARRAQRRGFVDLERAIGDAAARDELTPQELADARKNLEDAPHTAAAVAAGSIKLRQVIDPAETQAYETALRERSAASALEGRRDTAGRTSRLSAAPVLTRFVPDKGGPGGRRYRQPRFAGPPW